MLNLQHLARLPALDRTQSFHMLKKEPDITYRYTDQASGFLR